MRLISGCVRPTQTPWLPVLVNIAPPCLRRKVDTDNLLATVENHPEWPLHADIVNHPAQQLTSRRPIWAEAAPIDTTTQWEEDWLSASVVNQHLVCDPTIQQPGFDLLRQSWTLLNHFRTDQGPCRANLHKWGLAASELCDCGQRHTMGHIVDSCPLTQLDGGLTSLHKADDDAVTWLKTMVATALAK